MRKRSSSGGGGVESGGSTRDVTDYDSRTNMQAQQQLMASASSPPPYYCSARRALCTMAVYALCIYLDVVASNVATNRWRTELTDEQKDMPLPDVIHDSFELPSPDRFLHDLLKEHMLVVLGAVLILGFVVPYDVLGLPVRGGGGDDRSRPYYRRYEACTRFFETRSVLELMRALSVWVTTQADPHGLHCMNIEAHAIDNIYTNFTFARCGDNLYSGHASNLISFALAIQTYLVNMALLRRRGGPSL